MGRAKSQHPARREETEATGPGCDPWTFPGHSITKASLLAEVTGDLWPNPLHAGLPSVGSVLLLWLRLWCSSSHLSVRLLPLHPDLGSPSGLLSPRPCSSSSSALSLLLRCLCSPLFSLQLWAPLTAPGAAAPTIGLLLWGWGSPMRSRGGAGGKSRSSVSLFSIVPYREAERLLEPKPPGCYLVRFSESVVTFVLTYR